MRKVIFDVDTGSDDAVELIYALKSSQLDVIGITTVFGSEPVEKTTEHTLQVLEMLNKSVPVYKGCPKSLVSDIYDDGQPIGLRANKTKDAAGKTIGFHEVFSDQPPVRKPESIHAVTFLTTQLMQSDEKITLVASGALTNIALSFRVQPEIKEHIEEIVIMGGGVNMSNKTASAEGNFFRDAEAAKIVLESGCPITLIPLDATYDSALTQEHLKFFEAINTAESQFIAKVISMRMKAYNTLSPLKQKDVAIVHDLLCTFYLLDPSVIYEFAHYPCTVCIDHNEACGKLLCDRREGFYSPTIKTALLVNKEIYEQILYSF